MRHEVCLRSKAFPLLHAQGGAGKLPPTLSFLLVNSRLGARGREGRRKVQGWLLKPGLEIISIPLTGTQLSEQCYSLITASGQTERQSSSLDPREDNPVPTT